MKRKKKKEKKEKTNKIFGLCLSITAELPHKIKAILECVVMAFRQKLVATVSLNLLLLLQKATNASVSISCSQQGKTIQVGSSRKDMPQRKKDYYPSLLPDTKNNPYFFSMN